MAACALALAVPAAAQVSAQLPPGAEPGRDPRPPLEVPATPPGTAVTVPEAPAATAPPGAEDARFRLEALDVEGATAFPPDDLRTLYADLLGTEISVADAFRVAGEIELRYRTAGYVTSRVVVPQQTIEDGRFRIVVIEGFISDIVVEEGIGPAVAAIVRLLEPLRGVRPIAMADIERRLLLSNDLAGLTVRGTLEPAADAQGGSRLLVKADREAQELTFSIDNRNSRYLGRGEALASARFNSIGSRAESVTLNARVSDPPKRAWSVGGGYQALYGEDGLMLGLLGSYSVSEPGKELEVLEVKSDVVSLLGTASYPLIRSREENLRLVGEYEYRRVDTDLLGGAFNRDRLHVVRGGASYDRADRWDGITAVQFTLHQGIDVLDANEDDDPLSSRADGDAEFGKVTLDVTRVQRLPAGLSLL